MQSTGQTSTHDRSLTLMQGSAMTYDIPSPECEMAGNRRRRIANLDCELAQSRDFQVSKILVGIQKSSVMACNIGPDQYPRYPWESFTSAAKPKPARSSSPPGSSCSPSGASRS